MIAGMIDPLRHLAAALLAALYWLAAGSLCFMITGTDPIDAVVTQQSLPDRLAVVGIMASCIAIFALIGRWRWGRRRGHV